MKVKYDAYGIMEYLINQIWLPLTLKHCTRLQTANIQYDILSDILSQRWRLSGWYCQEH